MLVPVVALVLASSLLVVGESHHAVDGPHQERQNRLLPHFQPFDHPSKKIEDSTSTHGGKQHSHRILPYNFSGPISEVEWVEKVVPVFGKIKIPKKDGNADSFCNKVPLVLTLVVGGCVLLSFLMKQKTIEEEKKVNKQKIEEQEQSSSRLEAAHVSQFKLAETGHFPHCSLEKENVEDAEKMEKTETEERLVQKFIKDDHKDDSHNTVIQVDRNIKEQKSNEPSNAKYREVNEPPETARSLTDTERGNRDNKRRLDNILQPTVEKGPEWTTKIKTFKLTKYPKYHTSDVTEHGRHINILDILDVVQLQNVTEIKSNLKTAFADITIEGGSCSRLRITVVDDTSEAESVSRTMTLKEYMCSVSNKMIEEAMRRVKQDCSIDNIKHLAETIKKYRPESTEMNNSQSLT